jgi:hypothetical protein
MSATREFSVPSRSAWHAAGLRWIGSLFFGAADFLDRPSIATEPMQPRDEHLPAEDFLDDIRFRIRNRYY